MPRKLCASVCSGSTSRLRDIYQRDVRILVVRNEYEAMPPTSLPLTVAAASVCPTPLEISFQICRIRSGAAESHQSALCHLQAILRQASPLIVVILYLMPLDSYTSECRYRSGTPYSHNHLPVMVKKKRLRNRGPYSIGLQHICRSIIHCRDSGSDRQTAPHRDHRS
jgi:hypothetical protein